jgi:putative DNA primase/helicase
MSTTNIISDFLDFMRQEGVEPVDTGRFCQDITSGEVIRFDCVGDTRGRKNGWAKLYLDARPAGAFGNWKHGINRRWSSGTTNELTPEEKRRLREEWAEAQARREQLRDEAQREAAQDAIDLWNRSGPVASHDYAVRKQIKVGPLRQSGSGLLVPMYDDEGMLWNIQRISLEGEKRFLRGARIDGLFCIIGSFDSAREAVIGEGYATLDAVNQASGMPCIVAFNTSNLAKVARIWAARRPDLQFIIFADDDEATAQKAVSEGRPYKNPGIEAAEAVAQEIGAKVAYPPRRAA